MSPLRPTDNGDWRMMAIVEKWGVAEGGVGGCPADNTLQYLFLLLFKVALNLLVASFCAPGPARHSCVYASAVAIFAADLGLAGAVAVVWLLEPAAAGASSTSPGAVCFVLAHASTVYSLLPVPVLALGAVDYAWGLGRPAATRRSLCSGLTVLAIWALAATYSYARTGVEVLELWREEGGGALVCEVQTSSAVGYFCRGLTLAILCVLLLYARELPRWLRAARRLSARWEAERAVPKSDLAFCDGAPRPAEGDKEGLLAKASPPPPPPPLFLSHVLGFSSTWMPFLVTSVVCEGLGLVVPAYIAVNLLWLACVNSLLVGSLFWAKGERLGPATELPDAVCEWRMYRQLSRGLATAVSAGAEEWWPRAGDRSVIQRV